jgi:hypothetical protein
MFGSSVTGYLNGKDAVGLISHDRSSSGQIVWHVKVCDRLSLQAKTVA